MPVCVEGYTPKGGHHELPNKNKYLMLLDVTASVRDEKGSLLLSAATVYTGKQIKETLYGYRPGYPYVLHDKFKDNLFVYDLTNKSYCKLTIGNLHSKVGTTTTMAMAWVEEPEYPEDKSWSGRFVDASGPSIVLLELFLNMPLDMVPQYLDAGKWLSSSRMGISVLKARLQGLIPVD